MVHSILERADKSQIRDEPFPHLIMDNALPEAYYAELEAAFPSLDFVAGQGELDNNMLYLRSALDVIGNFEVAAVWRDFFAFHCSADFFHQACSFWRERIDRLNPDLEENFGKPLEDFTVGLRQPRKHENPENKSADVMMDCQFGMSSPVRSVSSVRGPHVDNRAKLFAALLYFRHPDDDSTGGELELYRLKGRRYPNRRMTKIDAKYIECVERVPYGANRLVVWLNSAYSIHGVSPRSIANMPRRYINFLGECYAGKRDDYFTAFSAEGFSPRGLIDQLRA